MFIPRIALLLPVHLAGCAIGPAPQALPQPSCRATLRGEVMTTVVDFPSGFRLEGQWSVLGLGPPTDNEAAGRMVADLLLDQLAQATSVNSEPVTLPFYTSLRLRSEAGSAAEALKQVADTWCSAVVEANRRGLRFDRLVHTKRGRIA